MNKLITLEGGEGTGKSTQSVFLFKSLKKVTKKVILTREPGGTIQGEKIREILVQKQKFEWDPITELLLINAARNEHLKNVIIPSIKQNVIVCDRFIDSTYAYQILAKGIKKKYFEFINEVIIKKIIPKITFLIDISPKIGLSRTMKRKSNENRYESYNIKFHEKVRKSYLKLARRSKRIRIIDGTQSRLNVHKSIIDILNKSNFLKTKIPYTLDNE